jgi:type II secretory pathway pseudopilin PulG
MIDMLTLFRQHHLKQKRSTQQGFSLIEIILYVAILTIILSGMITFAWDVIYGQEKALAQQTVQQAGRLALERISYEIRQAEAVTLVSASEISLNTDAGTKTILLNAGSVTLDGVALTSDQITVNDLTFTDYSQGGSDHISIEIEIASDNQNPQFAASFTSASSVELNAQFNQERNALFDFSGMNLHSSNERIRRIDVENTGDTTLVIDAIRVSWSGTVGTPNITRVRIDGTNLWTGSAGSGTTLD